MLLSLMTWPEVEKHLADGICAMLPVGSVEQHGPMGLIGTDTICAREIAARAATLCGAIVAPEIAYTPAPFNTGFPGTLSITPEVAEALLTEVCGGLLRQGFLGVFVVNGHGANLEPLAKVAAACPKGAIHVQSWWAPAPVAALRTTLFGDWEGMHATPSEVAITQALHGRKPEGAAANPPEKLSPAFIAAHAGDRHGPPDEHRAAFPDGRVGSHSALATPELGRRLLDTAAQAIAEEYIAFLKDRRDARGL